LLHGRHDPSPLRLLWPQQTGPATVLSDDLFDALASLGSSAPVVVLLNGGAHSYYHDRNDGAWGSMILDEAIPDAARRFGTPAGRVAIGGISMGGFGAIHLAAVAPRRFCAVGGHSAALWESPAQTPPGAFDNAADFARNDVFAAIGRGRFDGLRVWPNGGDQDWFRRADREFARRLGHRGVAVAYHVWPGHHDRAYWRAHMAAYLRFYAHALQSCAGTP
jgi:enterochelin esterase-like enzyme